jgi:hypothetical protein
VHPTHVLGYKISILTITTNNNTPWTLYPSPVPLSTLVPTTYYLPIQLVIEIVTTMKNASARPTGNMIT